MLEQLKNRVYNANQDLLDLSSYQFPWVSVSAIDRNAGKVIFMSDGGALSAEEMLVTDLDGRIIEGKEPPICDSAVHLRLYREFPEIGSIARPYSRWATVFAQLALNIPVLGTVHGESFSSDILSTGLLAPEVLCDAGSVQIAEAIIEAYRAGQTGPMEVPAILVACLGAYTFGSDAREAVSNAAILDETAFLAYHTMQLDPGIRPMQLRGCTRRQ